MRSLFLLIFILHTPIFALQVRIMQSIVDVVPGQVTTMQVSVVNTNEDSSIVVGHLTLPPLWQAIPSNDMISHIPLGQRAIQTLQFKAPESALPGEYPINYTVWVRDNPSIIDQDSASLVIGKVDQHLPLSLEITSPPSFEVDPGEVIYVSALISNETDCLQEEIFRIATPENWSIAPQDESLLSLEGGQSKVVIFGVKVPQDALAGEHCLNLELGSIKKTLSAIVHPQIALTGSVIGLDKSFYVNQIASLEIRYTNQSNVPLKVFLETITEPFCCVQCNEESFWIAPYETKEIPIILEPSIHLEGQTQFLLVKIMNTETGEQLYQNPMTFTLNAPGKEIDDPYIRIPTQVRGLVLGDRNGSVIAGEWVGKGCINPEEERFLEFVFRVPSHKDHVIYNIDERLYASIYDPEWNLELGDTVYALSPLTQRYRYGRGACVQRVFGDFEAGVQYTQNTLPSDCNPRELGTYFQYAPASNWTVSLNYLHKVEQHIPTSQLATLSSTLEFPEKIITECEVGNNFISSNDHQDTFAYRIESHGKLFNDCWFDIEKVYAGPAFFGYYNHLQQFSSTVDFPIYNRLRLNLNVSRIKQNFFFCPEDVPDASIPKQNSYMANLTYSMNEGCSFSLNGLLLRGRDRGFYCQSDFFQKWTGCSLFLSSSGYQLSTNLSFGQQDDFIKDKTTHGLQRYYIYLSKKLTSSLSGSLFYDTGNINYYDARAWSIGYGGALSYRFARCGYIEAFFQKLNHTSDQIDLSQYAINAGYTFQNAHSLQIMAQHYRYKCHYPNDTVCMISYSIPFNLPFGKRKDIGDLTGCVFDTWNQSFVSGALVACGPYQKTSGPDGRFLFSSLPRGEHLPEVALLPDNLIENTLKKTPIFVAGGKETDCVISVSPSCSLKAEVISYAYKDLLAFFNDPNQAEMIPQGGLEGIRIAISKDDGEEIYSSMTNLKGVVDFPRLRPGKWQIKVFEDEIPPLCHLDQNNLILEILPYENPLISFKILPEQPQIYKLN